MQRFASYALSSKKTHWYHDSDNYPRTTYTPSINFSTTASDGTHCPLLHVYMYRRDADITGNARECGGCQRAAPRGTASPQRPQRRRTAARRHATVDECARDSDGEGTALNPRPLCQCLPLPR
jgi:hypothetical protein